MPRRRKKKKSSKSKLETAVQDTKKEGDPEDRIYINVKGQKIPARKKEVDARKTEEQRLKEEYIPEGHLHNFLVNRTGRPLLMHCYKIPTRAYSRDDNREEFNAKARISVREQADRRGIRLNDADILVEAFPYGSEIYVKAYAFIDGKKHGDIEQDNLPRYIPIGKEGLFREE